MHPPLRFPLRRTRPQPWAPLTDAEWEALAALIPRQRGRPPADRRRTFDAIFWVACSRGPWRELPAELGRADTAHRALRRYAASGLLERLLIAVSRHPLGGDPILLNLEWRVVRAFRRAWRQLSGAALGLARRLGLESALPAPVDDWPRPDLSELILHVSRITMIPGQLHRFTAWRGIRKLLILAKGRVDRFRTTE
jgi:transposase